MYTLDDLKAKARPGHAVAGRVDFVLVLGSDAAVEEVIMGLSAYFGEDDDRQTVRLIVQGEEIGYLARTDLYDFVVLAEKGIGDADYSLLPGRGKYRLIELRCPLRSCEQRMLVTSFDENDPPQCPVHAGVGMELAQ